MPMDIKAIVQTRAAICTYVDWRYPQLGQQVIHRSDIQDSYNRTCSDSLSLTKPTLGTPMYGVKTVVVFTRKNTSSMKKTAAHPFKRQARCCTFCHSARCTCINSLIFKGIETACPMTFPSGPQEKGNIGLMQESGPSQGNLQYVCEGCTRTGKTMLVASCGDDWIYCCKAEGHLRVARASKGSVYALILENHPRNGQCLSCASSSPFLYQHHPQ